MNGLGKLVNSLFLGGAMILGSQAALKAEQPTAPQKDEKKISQAMPALNAIVKDDKGIIVPEYCAILTEQRMLFPEIKIPAGGSVELQYVNGATPATFDIMVYKKKADGTLEKVLSPERIPGRGPYPMLRIDTKTMPLLPGESFVYSAQNEAIPSNKILNSGRGTGFVLPAVPECPPADKKSDPTPTPTSTPAPVPEVKKEERKSCEGIWAEIAPYMFVGSNRKGYGADIAFMKQLKKKDKKTDEMIDSKTALGILFSGFNTKQTLIDTLQDSTYLGHIRGLTQNITEENITGVGAGVNVKKDIGGFSVNANVALFYLFEHYKDVLRATATDINTGLNVKDPVECRNQELIKEFCPRLGLGISKKIGECSEIGIRGLVYTNFPSQRTVTYRSSYGNETKVNQNLGKNPNWAVSFNYTKRFK